eukprot:Pgem_evm1s19426
MVMWMAVDLQNEGGFSFSHNRGIMRTPQSLLSIQDGIHYKNNIIASNIKGSVYSQFFSISLHAFTGCVVGTYFGKKAIMVAPMQSMRRLIMEGLSFKNLDSLEEGEKEIPSPYLIPSQLPEKMKSELSLLQIMYKRNLKKQPKEYNEDVIFIPVGVLYAEFLNDVLMMMTFGLINYLLT